jgi:hypothetical protein
MSPQGEREVTAGMIDVVHHGPIALVTLRRPPAKAQLEKAGAKVELK